MPYFLLYGIFALWVLFDGISRKVGAVLAFWVLGTAVLGPLILPVYLATRPLEGGEVREGGKAWNVLKNFAILWTIVMAIVTVVWFLQIGRLSGGATGDAETFGKGIGILAGITALMAVWFFPTMGAAMIGFFLKKNTIVETGPTGPLNGLTSHRSAIGGWAGLAGAAILALVLMASSTTHPIPAKGTSTFSAKSSNSSATSAESAPQVKKSGMTDDNGAADTHWVYESQADEMGRGATKIATLESINEADFDFPYEGGSKGSLIVRDSPKYGRDVIFGVTKGQFLCGVDSCQINVRLDAGKPIAIYANKSADGQSNDVFLPYSTMVRYLQRAKVIRIEASFYDQGSRVFEFHTQGLDMKQLARR